MSASISRRHLLAAALPLASGFAAAATGQRAAKQAVQPKARPFDLKNVTLSPGPLRDLMEANRRYLHDLEADRMLHMFRVTAGLPSSAEPLAGWERPDIELRGHFAGHYLSANALMAASAHDEELKAKGAAMVAEMARCQKALGSGYLSTFPSELFDRLRDGLPVWAPWYTIHKVMAGLVDQYTHCGNRQALDVAEGMAGWCKRWAAQFNDAAMARVLEVEHGGMNETLANLYAITAGARCGDYYERAFFNGILGTLNPKDAMTMYYVPLASGYWKMFSTPRNSFWCCTGSGVETFSKLPDSIYFHDEGGLWVNLFVASQLEWPEKGLKLRQETSFPDEEGSTFVFEAHCPVALELRIRTPYWATSGMTVKVNGQQHPAVSKQGAYRTVARTWKTGDKVEVSLPMSLHAHSMPDDPTLQAFLYGPLVLGGELGAEGLKREQLHGDPVDPMNNYELRGNPIRAPDLHESIERVPNQPLTFRTIGQTKSLTLIPLNRIFEERYAVYWRVRS